MFILAIAQCTQENHENVSQLWSAVKINNFGGTVATELKLANIMAGLMSHSSSFPCTWCDIDKKNLCKRGNLRTIENISKNYEDWKNAGANKKQARNYKCSINLPIFSSLSDGLILDIIPPPELHLMLGVVNCIFNRLLSEFEIEALKWAKSCNVQQEITHGSPAFIENFCKILLDKLDILRGKCSLSCLKFVQVFEDFKAVVTSCFGNQLCPDYKQKIASFKESYIALNISVTPKVHAVFFHIQDFCDRTQMGLGVFSEQAMKSVHFDFNSVCQKYKLSPDHPEYSSKLLRAICEYNSLHV